MIDYATLLDGREKGQFPISIGTSLALEGALDIYPDRPKKYPSPPLLSYGGLIMSIRTLYRNLCGSIEKESKGNLSPENYATALIEEMTIIKGVLEQHSPKTKPFYYLMSYIGLPVLYPNAILKTLKTDAQIEYKAMEDNCYSILRAKLKDSKLDVPVELTNCSIAPKSGFEDSMIITHCPLDLLSYTAFKRLTLQESNSGNIKYRGEWNTKLQGGKDHPRIPFDKMTIQMFGDTGGMFSPQPIAYRKTLLQIAESNKWTSLTTKDRVLLGVKQAHDFHLEKLVKSLY